ncbi:MAG TPA: RagB/SusD family nutrient uptake outer membrane protein [Chryseolinea sp.]|nr:RagB/SusD family nutrient uptake outer membrane protein [Chryseolinea sp.]
MKSMNNIIKISVFTLALFMTTSCHDLLDEDPENNNYTGQTDYTNTANMIRPLLGAYAEFQDRGWEDFPVIAVRGDDVNAGGLGDQQDFAEEDKFNYNKDYWMFNSVWQNLYRDILFATQAAEEVTKYKEFADDPALADQYVAEAKVLRSFLLFNLSRVWGTVIIPETSDPTVLPGKKPSTKDEVMQYISDQMDEAISKLPAVHPNLRTDIRGGVTRYTALAVKALANLELKNYQAVADATSQIISSNAFTLASDYYQLFKLEGKLNNENILELQYSDFGTASGNLEAYLFAFFGPESWAPKVSDAGGGWGFYEPSMKYIKFMLDRGETTRLQTSVIFTNRGIDEIKKDPKYATLPGWISNTTQSGDVFNNYNRAMFASGKHYFPSDQLTPGRTDYGTNKNFTCIRYAEVLLMHAEALAQGASGSAMTADQAVNAVRSRAGLGTLSGVTLDQVMDEKYAELAMEWGTRYYDMVRLERYDELSYDGRTFSESKIFLPYPQAQVDLLPSLTENP